MEENNYFIFQKVVVNIRTTIKYSSLPRSIKKQDISLLIPSMNVNPIDGIAAPNAKPTLFNIQLTELNAVIESTLFKI